MVKGFISITVGCGTI